MIINGKERDFAYTIEAADEIGKLCTDGDVKNIGSLFDGTGQDGMKNDIKIALILNKAAEDRKAYFDPHYHPEYLTEADFKFFLIGDLTRLEKEIARVMTEDSVTSVQTQEPKSSGKKN